MQLLFTSLNVIIVIIIVIIEFVALGRSQTYRENNGVVQKWAKNAKKECDNKQKVRVKRYVFILSEYRVKFRANQFNA